MKIVADNKIPYLKGALEPFAEVVYLPGKETTAEVVKDADAIITRTRTQCNEALFRGSSVKMIATATIGYDHIDTVYCESNGIEWTNAPGCNSWSVAQYILAALYHLANDKNIELDKLTIGVVGAGNVGSKVARLCQIIGMKVLVNDPPRMRAEGETGFVPIETIQQQADIITFHTPLTRSGNDKTFHLFDNDFMVKCKEGVIVINSSRGEVTDSSALTAGIALGFISELIIDCWENEPDINPYLLQKAFIATPHIAGYSKDGKANGTSMSVQAISRKFNLGIDNWQCDNIELPENTNIHIDAEGKNIQQIISEAVLATYPIWDDSKRLKQSPETFENQRGNYPVRREFPVYTLIIENDTTRAGTILQKLGFSLK
ncbi:MAG: 4-phosphoerythronate dehydrogenase PdxB [Prolixibacteraceae bacterium]|nr:4-phosphoerythronate dehydrogenase PdxB [Prolixibacteraceae bacterium]MBN2648551.1 4-phosphoerythronate dehydrogenase PdxB [Prolixibacteraceae bacterium]